MNLDPIHNAEAKGSLFILLGPVFRKFSRPKASAKRNSELSRPEITEDSDSSRDHVKPSPVAREPHFNRPRQVEADEFVPKGVEVDSAPEGIGDELVGLVMVFSASPNELPELVDKGGATRSGTQGWGNQ